MIDVPVFIATGERDVVPDPWMEPKAFKSATDITLTVPTLSNAADQAGMSRRYGGIHFAQGDLVGRALGRVIGDAVWAKAKTYFDATAYRPAQRHPSPRTLQR